MMQRFGKRVGNALRRFTRADSGVSAIEFAMLAPPFFVLLGVIMETGLMFFTEYAIQSGVQTAARFARTGQAQMNVMTPAQFTAKICGFAGVLIDCSKMTVYVRSDPDFATLSSKLPSLTSIGPTFGYTSTPYPTCFNPGQPSAPAAVVATYDWNFTMLGMGYFGNVNSNATRRLVGIAIFKNEPYPGTTATTCP